MNGWDNFSDAKQSDGRVSPAVPPPELLAGLLHVDQRASLGHPLLQVCHHHRHQRHLRAARRSRSIIAWQGPQEGTQKWQGPERLNRHVLGAQQRGQHGQLLSCQAGPRWMGVTRLQVAVKTAHLVPLLGKLPRVGQDSDAYEALGVPRHLQAGEGPGGVGVTGLRVAGTISSGVHLQRTESEHLPHHPGSGTAAAQQLACQGQPLLRLTKTRVLQNSEARRFQVPSSLVGSQVQPERHSISAVPMPW